MANRTTKSEIRDETKLMIDLADLWHERGLDLPTRTIYLGSASYTEDGEGGVDGQLAEQVIKNLHLLERIGEGPIDLILNNVGGDEYHGLAIVDAIRMCSADVVGRVRGHAMSMGSYILQACSKRLMAAHSVQLIHYGMSGYVGHAKTAEKWAEEAKRTNALMEQMYLARIREKHPRFSLEELQKLLDHDTFLDANASIALGLADDIG